MGGGDSLSPKCASRGWSIRTLEVLKRKLTPSSRQPSLCSQWGSPSTTCGVLEGVRRVGAFRQERPLQVWVPVQGPAGGTGWDRSEQLGFTSQGCLTRPAGSPRWIQLVRSLLLSKDCTTSTWGKKKQHRAKELIIKDWDFKALTPGKDHPVHRWPLQQKTDTEGQVQLLLLLSQGTGQGGLNLSKRQLEAGPCALQWVSWPGGGAPSPTSPGSPPLQPLMHQHSTGPPTAPLHRSANGAPALSRRASSDAPGACPRRQRSGRRWRSRRRRRGCGSCGG